MALIIKNMKMPESCYACKYKYACDLAADNGWIENKRDDKCPFEEVDLDDYVKKDVAANIAVEVVNEWDCQNYISRTAMISRRFLELVNRYE